MAETTPVRRAFETIERRRPELLRVLRPEQQLACAEGCAYCCYQRVSVTPLEVFELADRLRGDRDADSLEALLGEIRGLASRVRGRTALQHRGERCPLNDAQGSCVAYDSRPLLCRGANSFDADACARPGAGIPTYLELTGVAQAAQEELDRECTRISGRQEMLELSCALLVVLTDPAAEARWRRGEPVFAEAAHAWFEAGELHDWSRA